MHLNDETINHYLDRQLDAAGTHSVKRHLAACDDCRRREAALRSLFTTLEELPDLPLVTDLSGPVMARLTAEAQPWTMPGWIRLVLVAQLGAASGLLLYLWTRFQPLVAAAQDTLFSVHLSLPELPPAGRLLDEAGAYLENLGSTLSPAGPSPPPALWLAVLAVAWLAWLAGNGLLLRNRNEETTHG